jgi:AcrR family transcriptional regulator
MTAPSRRGRPPKGTGEERRQAVLAAARAEILEHGYAGTTMLGIARRCGSSKETIYGWFGSKQDLVAEIIEAEGRTTISALEDLLSRSPDEPATGLRTFARALLDLLCGPWSVAVNRAAMSSPELADLVLANGRHAVGPAVERALANYHRLGRLDIAVPSAAFRELYGLVVQDTQIRVLLGEDPPGPRLRRRQADQAVETFCRLHAR